MQIVKPITPAKDIIKYKASVVYTTAAIASAFGVPPRLIKPVNCSYLDKSR